MNPSLTHDAQETNHHPSHTREERCIVRGLVAGQTIRTVTDTSRVDDRMSVVNGAVEDVEDIAAENGGKSHHAEVLRETADAERVCH